MILSGHDSAFGFSFHSPDKHSPDFLVFQQAGVNSAPFADILLKSEVVSERSRSWAKAG
jgi:hypothetical protein